MPQKEQEDGSPGKDVTAGRVASLRVTVRGVVILMTTVLSGLALFFWIKTENVATRQFTLGQLTVAKLGARRVEEIVHHFENTLLAQSRAFCDEAVAAGEVVRSDMQALQALSHLGATDIVRLDEGGRAISTVAFEAAVVEPMHARAMDRCRTDGGGGICVDTDLDAQEIGMTGHTMVLSKRLPACSGAGRIALIVSWDRLGAVISQETAITRFTLGWIIDEHGTLLFHPDHPEMHRRSITDNDGSCVQCHADFAIARDMIRGRSGVKRLEVEGSESKLVAFSPMTIGGRQWSLAVSAPYSTVVGENRRALVVAVLASAFLIGLFMFVSYYLDRENRRFIGALQQNQETIRTLNAELEGKVQERTGQLEELYAEMRRIQRRHDTHQRLAIVGELASMVAHEVRTPLNSLAITSQRLLRSLGDRQGVSTAKIKRIVESQEYEIQRINNYIEEYLKFSRMPRRQVSRTDLNALIRRLTRFFAVEASRQGVQLHFDGRPGEAMADVDEEQITQVLLNILVNAMQAMPDGGDVFIETSEEIDSVWVQVRDTGVGIAKECLEDVFKPFFTTREDGTGLGLAISSRIVEENGGTIDCTSEQGHGTTFRIKLPTSQSKDEQDESNDTDRG